MIFENVEKRRKTKKRTVAFACDSPLNIDFAGQRPPFQGVLRPETNQYTPQNRKFCGWAVANEKFATAPFSTVSTPGCFFPKKG